MQTNDHELLRRFARERDDGAFRELVQRHLTTVFAVALRVTGDRQLAEEIAQSTFAELAGKAAALKPPTVVAGWLYRTSRHLALRGLRTEQRRRQREQQAAPLIMEEPATRAVAEQLDAAMDRLTDEERDVLILRFFEEQNLRDVGRELGLSEDAARMRVNRALDKLRDVFGKLGVTGSAAWLATTLPASASATVPAGLSSSIVTSVMGGAALATAAAAAVQTTTSTMNLFNLKTAAAVLGAAVVTGGTTYLVKEQQVDELRADRELIGQEFAQLSAANEEAVAAIRLRDEQIGLLKQDAADIHRLRGEVDRLNRRVAELNQIERLQEQVKSLQIQLDQMRPEDDPRQADIEFVYADSVARGNYEFRGYSTPESAWQSMLWSIVNLDAEAYLESHTDEYRARVAENSFKDMPAGVMPGGFKNGIMFNATGYHIQEVVPESDDEVIIKVFMEGANHATKARFKRAGNLWKHDGAVMR